VVGLLGTRKRTTALHRRRNTEYLSDYQLLKIDCSTTLVQLTKICLHVNAGTKVGGHRPVGLLQARDQGMDGSYKQNAREKQ
jgi:hypothetical protein